MMTSNSQTSAGNGGMTVAELARHLAVPADTVRHYTRIGLLQPRKDPVNGYKRYDRDQQHRLAFALQARTLGFTLADVEAILADADQGAIPCPRVRTLLETRLTEVEQRIQALQSLAGRMRKAMAAWSQAPDCAPDGAAICHLIESVASGDQEPHDD